MPTCMKCGRYFQGESAFCDTCKGSASRPIHRAELHLIPEVEPLSPAEETTAQIVIKEEVPALGVVLRNRYRVVTQTGDWMLGTTFAVEDLLQQDLPRTLFVLPSDRSAHLDSEYRAIFEQLLGIEHPNLVKFMDAELDADIKWFVTEAVEPGDIRRVVETFPGNALPEATALQYAWQLASGLSHLHHLHYIHKHLNPYFLKIGNEDTLKVLFFGNLFKTTAYRDFSRLYDSPEIILEREIFRETDIWSFGAILYEWLTGKTLLKGNNRDSLISQLKTMSKWERLPEISSSTNHLLQECLRFSHRQRFTGFDVILTHLDDILQFLKIDKPRSIGAVTPPSLNLVGSGAVAATASYKDDRADRPEPTDAAGFINRGRHFLETGNTPAAYEDLTRAINLDSRLAEAFFLRGLLMKLTHQTEHAHEDFSRSLTLDPGQPLALFYRGLIRVIEQYYDKALPDFQAAQKLDGNFTLIEQFIRAKSALRPDCAEYHVDLAYLHYCRGHLKLAVEEYSLALAKSPGDTRVLLLRGQAYDQLGEYPKALDDFDEYVRRKPDDVEGYANRGKVFFAMREVHRAIPDFAKAAEMRPNDANVFNVCGNANYDKRNYNQAIRDFTKAIELNPNDALAYLNRSMAWEKKGETEKARTDRHQAEYLLDGDKTSANGESPAEQEAPKLPVAKKMAKPSVQGRPTSAPNRTAPATPRHKQRVMERPDKIKPLGCGIQALLLLTFILGLMIVPGQ